MKNLFASLLLLLAFSASAQDRTAPTVFPNVLKTAGWAKFPYEVTLREAVSGSTVAIRKMLNFSGTVDGRDALDHAVTCLELIKPAGDENFSYVIYYTDTKLRKILLSRLTQAQGRTQKADLQQPMANWAPNTWKALNGQKPVFTNSLQDPGSSNRKEPAKTTPNTDATTRPKRGN